MNGDKYIDIYELEAIFQAELDKMYDPENPDVSISHLDINLRKKQKVVSY